MNNHNHHNNPNNRNHHICPNRPALIMTVFVVTAKLEHGGSPQEDNCCSEEKKHSDAKKSERATPCQCSCHTKAPCASTQPKPEVVDLTLSPEKGVDQQQSLQQIGKLFEIPNYIPNVPNIFVDTFICTIHSS